VAEVSDARLRVWVYRELMGSLRKKKRDLLREALDEKQRHDELDSIERRIWSAMKLYDDPAEQRDYIKRELKLWEQRTAP
jgi:hypothetical protein